MASPSSETPTKSRDSNSKNGSAKAPLLDARRISELAGFLVSVAGLLVLLSLASYSPQDPSLNTAVAAGAAPNNWIGPAGAYTADAIFQIFGWVAYLIPLGLLVAGARWLLVRPFQAPATKALGAALLITSLGALLELFPYTPAVRGAVRGSGLLGYLAARGLIHTFNHAGASILAIAVFLSSLFLVTRFSFSWAFEFLRRRFAFVKALAARWQAWSEARKEARVRKHLERTHVLGRPPIVVQKPLTKPVTPPPSDLPTEALEPVVTPITRPVPAPAQEAAAKPAPAAVARLPKSSETPAGPPPKIIGRGAHAYKLPSASLLRPPEDTEGIDEKELKERAARLTDKFNEFNVTGAVTQIHPGPVVTTYEFKPEAGIKYSRITSLVDDLCLAMKAESILIDRVAGKSTVGIEVPNLHREIIHIRELAESSEFAASPSRLTLCLGKDITGKIKIGDLTQMPHLLIAGSTGSGKSVALNCMIVSILYKSNPNEVKLILIDPKRLELGLYDKVPHLLTPIVTEPKAAANALRRAVVEMEERLKKLAAHGVRNIEQYNKIFEPDATLNLFDTNGERDGPLPYIVIVIDELADLMMVEPQGVEESITRLAQMARAVGIHLVLATQRPSVDVITGLIKANMPSRIAFRVASKVDSRTILDSNGAEALLGRGDMLFLPPGTARLLRLHGPLVTEQEIGRVVEWWKNQSQPQYNEEFLQPVREREREDDEEVDEEEAAELDAVYEDAVRLVVESAKASTSLLQRRLRLGYGRAARLIDMMEKDGIVSAPDGARPREVLKRPDWLQEVDGSLR
ncbi:MAG: DNA translocase FtsK [Acidobacteriia bacterium]|nr:DNA translocase FtsK [Terriglobia bacterium]